VELAEKTLLKQSWSRTSRNISTDERVAKTVVALRSLAGSSGRRGCQVKGQVFAVSASVLAEMDKLERISEVGGYRRVEIEVCSEQTDKLIGVQVYGKLVEKLSDVLIQCELAGKHTLADAKLYRSS